MSHTQQLLLHAPITMLLPAALALYVGRNLIGPLAKQRCPARIAILPLFLVGLVASLALIYWGEQDRTPIGPLVRVGFAVMGYLLTAASLLLVRDLLRVILWLTLRLPRHEGSARLYGRLTSQPIRYWSGWATLAIAAVCQGVGTQCARQPPVVEEFIAPVRNLPRGFGGYRILHLSDLHLRGTIDRGKLGDLVLQVNALDIDLIAITGDVVDGPLANLRQELVALGDMHARDGVYLVVGNHEIYADVDACVAEFRRLGITVLLNENALVTRGADRMVVAGVTNPQGGMHGGRLATVQGRITSLDSNPQVAVLGAPPAIPRILLAHQPVSVAQARGLGFDLALAGHTHGGQFFPWTIAVPLVFPYRTGLQRDGSMWVHVARGLGTFGPSLRLGSSPQIAVIELIGAPNSPSS